MGKGNILVVDDSPLVLDVISKFLCASGYKTITASNGMRRLRRHLENCLI